MNREEINLIIIAMDEELACLLDALDTYQEVKVINQKGFLFNRRGEKYLATLGKIGKVNTAFYLGQLAQVYNIKKIFNIGTSGGVSKSLNINDVVIAERVRYIDVDVTGFGYELGQVPHLPVEYLCDLSSINREEIKTNNYQIHYGLIVSSDSFITKNNYNNFPIDIYHPLSTEMESGAVMQCAEQLKIPALVIRSISDLVFREENEKDFDNNIKTACHNCVEVLLKII